jgi:hypothetical protein
LCIKNKKLVGLCTIWVNFSRTHLVSLGAAANRKNGIFLNDVGSGYLRKY